MKNRLNPSAKQGPSATLKSHPARVLRLLAFLLLFLVAFALLAACGAEETAGGTSGTASAGGTETPSMTDSEESSREESMNTEETQTPESTPDDPAESLFSMKEWTGAVGSTDAAGKRVNQSDITNIRRRPFHAAGTLVYNSVEAAVAGAKNYDFSLSPYYQCLTGAGHPWSLAVYKNEADAKKAGLYGEFFKPTYDMANAPLYQGNLKIGLWGNAYYGGFRQVTLPASWQTQGFDFPIYANTEQPWDAYGNGTIRVPNVPAVTNPVGFYRSTFSVDPTWFDGRRVIISFGGVESCYYLWINGHEVGYSEDSYDLSEFDITDYLYRDGRENLIAVQVYRWCDGSWFENQDMLRLAGIFRDVAIYAVPEVNLFDFQVATDLDDAYQNAMLSLKLTLANESQAEIKSSHFFEVSLYDAEGKAVIAPGSLTAALVGQVAPGERATLSLSQEVIAPHLWSDEDPYLYTLVITLKGKDGRDYGSSAWQLGFRELHFTKTASSTGPNASYDTVLLNGKPLLFKGVNRHDNWMETGKYIPKEIYERDVAAMKQLNINALRTSHYPNDPYLYYLCDTYGILVMAEANIESHWSVSEADSVRYFKNVLNERIEALVTREKNRTCVLVWSLDNECNACSVFTSAVNGIIRKIDPTRMIHSCTYTNGGGVDLASQMYIDVSGMPGWGNAANHMPYIQCEFDHAMGNSLGCFYEYWEMFRQYDCLLGGFIWDFADQTLATEIPTATGWDYYGTGKYYACGDNWKNVITQQDYCQNGILSADRDFQPEAFECRYVLQSVWFTGSLSDVKNRKITVYNEFSHVDLSAFDFTYDLLCDGVVIDSGSFAVSLAPRGRTTVEVPYRMPDTLTPDGEYVLNLYCRLREDRPWAQKGYAIAYEQLAVPAAVAHVAPPASSAMPPLAVEETGETLTVTGERFTALFDKTTGRLVRYLYDGEEVISAGPTANFARATTANERYLSFSWNKVSAGRAVSFDVQKGAVLTVTADETLTGAGNSRLLVTYHIYGDGEITVTMSLTMDPTMGEAAKVGSLLTLPGDFEAVTFYAQGPWEAYVDRARGAKLSRWDTTVSDLFYPYPCPQETGNRVGVRWLALTSKTRDTGLLFVAGDRLEAAALHYTVEELNAARNTWQLSGRCDKTYLSLDYGSRGVGSASCGPDTLTEYRLLNDGRDYTWSYTIVPFDKEKDDPAVLARSWREAPSLDEAAIDRLAAASVEALIEDLVHSPEAVLAVRRAYEALTPAQKALVGNLSLLETVEAQAGKTVTFRDASPNGFTVSGAGGGVLYEDKGSATGWAYSGGYTIDDPNGRLAAAFSGQSQFAIEMWARFDSLTVGNVLIAKGDTQVSIKIDGGNNLEFYVYDGGWRCLLVPLPQTGISAGVWFHLVCQRTAAGLETWINGQKVGTMAYTGNVNRAGEALTVGKAIGKDFQLNGAIGFVHLYARPLTEEEIAGQYAAYRAKQPPRLAPADALLWLDMSQGETS